METYQIRILKEGREVTSQAFRQASDYAAIRHAKSLAEQSDQIDHIEVWRGGRCLFTENPADRGA